MSYSLKKILLTITLLLSVCLTWFFFLYKPTSDKLEVIKAETNDLVLKVRSFRANDEQVLILGSRVDTLTSTIDLFKKGILARNGLPLAVHAMRKKGRIYGLEFVSVIPDYDRLLEGDEVHKGDVLRLPIHVKSIGSYRSFGRFVESLATLPFLVSLGDVKLDYNEKEHPALSIIFDAILFIQKSSQMKT